MIQIKIEGRNQLSELTVGGLELRRPGLLLISVIGLGRTKWLWPELRPLLNTPDTFEQLLCRRSPCDRYSLLPLVACHSMHICTKTTLKSVTKLDWRTSWFKKCSSQYFMSPLAASTSTITPQEIFRTLVGQKNSQMTRLTIHVQQLFLHFLLAFVAAHRYHQNSSLLPRTVGKISSKLNL